MLLSCCCRVSGAVPALRRASVAVAVLVLVLQNTLNRLYKPSQTYAGGTAGALREEARTGIKTKARNHRASAEQNVNALQRILAGQRAPLSTRDRYTALRNLRDLQDAIRYFDYRRPGGHVR